MIPQSTAPSYVSKSIASSSQQPVANPEVKTPSVADLFGLGVVLIIVILVSRQLTLNLYRSYQLHRFVVSLQRRATLERHLYRKSSAPVLQKSLSQRT